MTLDDVTIVAVDTRDAEAAGRALAVSSRSTDFGDAVLVSTYRPHGLDAAIRFVRIPKVDIAGYSRFMLAELHEHVQTKYCLIVQADGIVINPSCWDDSFLSYDYIGAPWPDDEEWISMQPMAYQTSYRSNLAAGTGRVGNGGFSLRSKRLLEFCCQHLGGASVSVPEDAYICVYNLPDFLNAGLRFAPVEVAARFSVENPIRECELDLSRCFGCHGRLPPQAARIAQAYREVATEVDGPVARFQRKLWQLRCRMGGV
jgi:hypothetical protein